MPVRLRPADPYEIERDAGRCPAVPLPHPARTLQQLQKIEAQSRLLGATKARRYTDGGSSVRRRSMISRADLRAPLCLRFELLHERGEIRGDRRCKGVVLVLQALPNC
jgi:hypothetical protein